MINRALIYILDNFNKITLAVLLILTIIIAAEFYADKRLKIILYFILGIIVLSSALVARYRFVKFQYTDALFWEDVWITISIMAYTSFFYIFYHFLVNLGYYKYRGFLFLLGIIVAFTSRKLALKKNRSRKFWFAIGFFMPFLSLVLLGFFLKKIDLPRKIDKMNPEQYSKYLHDKT